MTDLSSLSDAELTALYQKQSAPSGATTDLSKMSDDELKAAYAASKPTDTSIGGALSQGASSVVQGYGKTIKDYINKDVGAAIENNGVAQARPNYKSATEGFMRPEDGADKHTLGVDWSKLPRMLVEQAPALAVDLAAQKVGGIFGPIGRYAANAISFGGRTAGAEAERRAAERTGDPNAEPSTTDKLVGLGSTAVQTGLNQYGLNKILRPSKVTAVGLEGAKQGAGNVIKAGLAEGGTNAAQNLVSQGAAKAGTSGLDTIDWQEVKAAALAGGALGAGFSAPHGAREASIATRLRNSTDEHSVMAANRIKENGSVDTAKQDIDTELKAAAREVTNPSPETVNAIQRAKTGGKLTAKDLDAIDAVGDDQLSSLVRQATALSKMSDKPGGLSGKAESFVKGHPLWAMGGVVTPHALATAGFLPAFAAALPGAGALAAGAGIGYAGMRGFDSLMGLRDKGGVFAERIGDGTGKVRPDAPPPLDAEPSQAAALKAQHQLETGLQKMVEKLQSQKRKDTAQEALPLLRQLAARNKLMPEQPEPVREQVPPPAPVVAEPKSVDTRGATPQPAREGESIVQQALAAMQAQRARGEQAAPQEDFVLPESPYWRLEPKEAADAIFQDAVSRGKEIDHPSQYKESIVKRLEGEEAIFYAISNEMPHEGQAKFQSYIPAMLGADSPPVMRKVKAHMLAAMPEYAAAIEKHLTEEAIKKLWEPKRQKKKA